MEEKDQLKLERLQSTLNRAYKNIPFHRNRFTERSILPEHFVSLKDLKKLMARNLTPAGVTNMDIIQNHFPPGLAN